MNKFFRNISFYLIIIILAIWMFDSYGTEQKKSVDVSYSNFVQNVQNKDVSKVVIQDQQVTGTLKSGAVFKTIVPKNADVVPMLSENNVAITAELPPQPSWLLSLATSILPMVLIFGLWFFVMNQRNGGGSGGAMSFGKSRAKMYDENSEKVTFKDVAGADEAKQELQEVVEFLKDPKKYNELGANIPKGVLLYGSPGTGKTLLAKAVAGEAGVPFFSISGSDFVEMFVGVGASRVRDLFAQAKKSAPAIIFIDEIDAVGRQRGTGVGGGHDEREQTLNQLLVEMDGFASNVGIIMMAATNRPDVLDPALLRPGRFDRQIVVDRPDLKGRRAILDVHIRKVKMDKNVDLDIIARRTPGFTGADLSNLVNEAALLAARKNKKTVSTIEMEEAAERVMMGPERKSRVMSDEDKRLTAYHEGGHTLVGMLLKDTDPVHKVTIIPRGRAGGYTLSLPEKEQYYTTRSALISELKLLLGGRVAEQVVLKEISTGASNDLQRATQIAKQMVCEYGMSEKLGVTTFGHHESQVFLGRDMGKERDYSEEVASEIDKEVRRYIDKAYAETVELMEANVDKLHLIAKALIERETLDGDELKELMETGAIAPKPEKVEATDIPAPIKPPVGEVENDNTPVIKTAKETLKSLDEVAGKETAKTASANDVSTEDSVAKASIADENKTK